MDTVKKDWARYLDHRLQLKTAFLGIRLMYLLWAQYDLVMSLSTVLVLYNILKYGSGAIWMSHPVCTRAGSAADIKIIPIKMVLKYSGSLIPSLSPKNHTQNIFCVHLASARYDSTYTNSADKSLTPVPVLRRRFFDDTGGL